MKNITQVGDGVQTAYPARPLFIFVQKTFTCLFTFILFILFGSMWAMPLPARAYSLKKTDSGAQIRWSQDAVAIRLAPYSHSKLGLDPENLRAATVMAAEAWRGYDGVPDVIVKSGEPASRGHHGENPTNGIYVLEDWPYEKKQLAITLITYRKASGKLLDVDILINPDARLELFPEGEDAGPEDAFDVAAVLTHEMGHVLGLGESDADPMATMWPTITCAELHKRSVEEDDEAGVITAYSGNCPDILEDAAGCGKMSVARGASRPSSALIPLMAMLLLWLICRRRLALNKQCMLALACGSALCLPSPEHPASPRVIGQGPQLELASSTPASSLIASHPRSYPVAADRLRALMGGASRAHRGIARRLETSNENGMFWTRYRVTTAAHEQVDLRLPGGTINGITQRVGEGALPADGEELVVVPRPDNAPGWAHYRNGQIYGGSLGHGPAIQSPL